MHTYNFKMDSMYAYNFIIEYAITYIILRTLTLNKQFSPKWNITPFQREQDANRDIIKMHTT